MCIALTWLTIIGSDYIRNKKSYHIKSRDVRFHKGHKLTRLYSLFNIILLLEHFHSTIIHITHFHKLCLDISIPDYYSTFLY